MNTLENAKDTFPKHPRLLVNQWIKGREIYLGRVRVEKDHAATIADLQTKLHKSQRITTDGRVDETGAQLICIH